MLLKLLILVGSISLFALFVFKAARSTLGGSNDAGKDRPAPGAPRRREATQDLVKCPGCGIFLPSDRTCDCKDAS